MRTKIIVILELVWSHEISKYEALKQILSLLDGSELDSLDAQPPSNDAYSIVGGSHACGADQSEYSEHTSDETLGKIIDDGNNFYCASDEMRLSKKCTDQCPSCFMRCC